MPKETLTKTVCQYSAAPIQPETMERLLAVAADFRRVKEHIYARYGGIRSMAKLYPGYTVQNEMTKDGLRKRLGLPTAYFYPAIFEALADIRNRWATERAHLRRLVHQNVNFTEEARHYLFFVLSVETAFHAVMNREPIALAGRLRTRYAEAASHIDTARLDNYLRRKLRAIHRRPSAEAAARFAVHTDGYRYANHGIFLSTKERRQRVFIPLTDGNRYARQLDVQLLPEKHAVEIRAPIEVRVRHHEDWQAAVGLAMGMRVMLTTDEGHTYGEKIWARHLALAEWLRAEHTKYQKNRAANPGRKKYEAEKRRREGRLHSYINQALNCFLRTEKPRAIYIMRFPLRNRFYGDKAVSWSMHVWQRGYIRRQLRMKCRAQGVDFVEVFGKGIGDECSQCGRAGKREDGIFSCACGCRMLEKQNMARNAKRRGKCREARSDGS